MSGTRIHNSQTEEITSALFQDAADCTAANYYWNSNSDTPHPFKLWCDGDYSLSVVLWGDYKRCLEKDDLANLTDYAGVLPFGYGANDATIAVILTGLGDYASTDSGVTAVR